VCYSISPQVHADDDRSILENAAAQADVALLAARALAGGKKVFVRPVTLKRRRNADATGVGGSPLRTVDARQGSLLGAA
jgi:hypothetical protein